MAADGSGLADAFDLIPIALTITSAVTGRLVEVNEQFLRATGYARADALGKTPVELGLWIAPEQRQRQLVLLQRGETIEEEPARFRMRNGEERDCVISARRIDHNGEPAIMSVVVDVTVRRKLERRISAEWAVSRVLATATSVEAAVPAVLRALATELEMVACDLWLPEPDGLHLRCADAFVDDPEGRLAPFVAETRAIRFASGVGLPGRVWRDRRAAWIESVADDTNFPRAATARASELRSGVASPVMTADACLGVIELYSSAPLATDAALLATLSALGAQIGQFLLRMRSEAALRDADRRKDEFLAILAHELRNPLAPLRSSVQRLRTAPHDPDRVAATCSVMERQVARMVRLIDDLLDVSRITHGQLSLKRKPVALATVVVDAVETVQPLVDEMQQAVDVSLPAEPVWIDGDSVRLAQALGNLLGNASKYSPRGGRIAVDAHVEDGAVVVSVRDRGVGIAADVLPQIFELFTRAHAPQADHTGGLGIGLSLVKRLVEMHGGTVSAESDGPGRGSAFTMHLPVIAAPDMVERAVTRERHVQGGATRRILVVDDNRDAAESIATLLELWGHAVATAHDGVDAVDTAAAFRPDVVLLDIGLPGMNGYDACRALRAQPAGRNAVIVALTGWGQDADRRNSEVAGFDAHLVKPVEESALREVIAWTRPAAT
jgi:PAS domain S-box-containing protein